MDKPATGAEMCRTYGNQVYECISMTDYKHLDKSSIWYDLCQSVNESPERPYLQPVIRTAHANVNTTSPQVIVIPRNHS